MNYLFVMFQDWSLGTKENKNTRGSVQWHPSSLKGSHLPSCPETFKLHSDKGLNGQGRELWVTSKQFVEVVLSST